MKKAFTLIELLLGFAVIGMLMTGVTLSLAAVLKSTARTSLQAKVRNEGEYLMETISQSVRYGSNVTCSAGVLSMDPKTSGDPSPAFACVDDGSGNGTFNITKNTQTLNSTQVKISDCSFTCVPSDTAPTDVQITFSVDDTNGIVVNPIYFDTDIVLRNTQ